MAVRSNVFWTVPSLVVGSHDLYTCPADRTALIKTLTVTARAGTPTVSILHKRGASETPLLRNRAFAVDELYVLPFDVVLIEGDKLRVTVAGTGFTAASYGAGSLLFGDPA